MRRQWIFLAWLYLFAWSVDADVSSMDYVPQGSYPLLYRPKVDKVMHLDQDTFEDTVFAENKTNSFLVEFYADWCGFCRAFVPYYRDLSWQVQDWSDVSVVAAINCADFHNFQVCRSNGISTFPQLKYFPRDATNFTDAQPINADHDVSHSVDYLRNELVKKILNESKELEDFPNLDYIGENDTIHDLWSDVKNSTQYLTIVFEKFDSVGTRAILDMWKSRSLVAVRRAMFNTSLADQLSIPTFPYAAVYKRDDDQHPFFASPYRYSVLQLILEFVGSNQTLVTTQPRPTEPPPHTIDCTEQPEQCAKLYYVSESDMLKAMRMALFDEVIRAEQVIEGDNFKNLKSFVSLLADHFPTKTQARPVQEDDGSTKQTESPKALKKSETAKKLFGEMKQFLSKQSSNISAEEWQEFFEEKEKKFKNPFPVEEDWEHCKGNAPQYRGYTCGLWTTFHTLTINSYMNTQKAKKMKPIEPLKIIRGWVESFFGCKHCKRHFLNLTRDELPMDKNITQKEDMFLYLWRAHNNVNNRIHNDVTEDPQFTKYQFPPIFLCPSCHDEDKQLKTSNVKEFLLQYYRDIRPIGASDSKKA